MRVASVSDVSVCFSTDVTVGGQRSAQTALSAQVERLADRLVTDVPHTALGMLGP